MYVKTLMGTVANRGIAEGRVKIIYSVNESNKIEKGDILVTKMTVPDMIMAIDKAAAIVTDEGGILCHAAIISRELGKPCIVGTQNATKILKDDDLVRVDAESGIVEKVMK
jgi:pyruvate,water dikinase